MKKMKTITASVLAVIMVLTMLAGCGSGAGKGAFTDMAGREIKLDKPAEKIVALEPSDCEILYAIGAGGTLVGRGEWCDYPAEVMNIPSVQSGAETNIEEIIKLQPEVVIMTKMAQTEEQVNALENAGIKVVITDAQDIQGIYSCIELIGKVTGNTKEASNVISSMKSAFDKIKKDSKDSGGTVYFEVSELQYGLWAAGSATFMDEAAQMVGLTNIFADQTGWVPVSEEDVISRNPDYIVTISMYFGEGPTPEEEIASRSGWGKISAVVNGNIIDIQDNSLSRPSPRLVDGVTALYDLVKGSEELQNAA